MDDLVGMIADSLGLDELLAHVATLAVHAIPGAEGAGVTLLQTNHGEGRNVVAALGASAPYVAAIDDIQYVTVTAVRSARGQIGCAQRTVAAAAAAGSGGRRDQRVRARQGRLR